MPLLTTIKINKFFLIPAVFTAVALGSFSANFSPSNVFKQFAPIVWIPMGLLVLGLMIRDPDWKARTFPLWRKIISYAIFGCFTCYLSKFVFVYGFGDLVTRIFGTPFQESSIIVKKTSARRFCLHSLKVDKFQTASGGICLDVVWGVLSNDYKEIWETSKKGDGVMLIGKKSSVGSSITTIQFEKQSISQ